MNETTRVRCGLSLSQAITDLEALEDGLAGSPRQWNSRVLLREAARKVHSAQGLLQEAVEAFEANHG